MKNEILVFVGLILCVFLVSGCGLNQQPTVLPGNQINESTPAVSNGSPVQLPLVSVTRVNETPVINTTPIINITSNISKINQTMNITLNNTNRTNST